MPTNVYIGTSGWYYDHWENVLYPSGTPPADRLAIYQRKFKAVEINATFYRMPFPNVIKGWYRNDKNVVVDNGMDSRKYVEYGVNMIMYTHGDKEKPSEMPLIMATEQPEMFARCSVREVHCGHLHKEMVNEYRGIKSNLVDDDNYCGIDDKRYAFKVSSHILTIAWLFEKDIFGDDIATF
jgi:hypothetical protein